MASSAGIGRSGTFCVVHAYVQLIRSKLLALRSGSDDGDAPLALFNLTNTIIGFRKQRPGMVQTKAQLKYCYESIIKFLQATAKDNGSSAPAAAAALRRALRVDDKYKAAAARKGK